MRKIIRKIRDRRFAKWQEEYLMSAEYFDLLVALNIETLRAGQPGRERKNRNPYAYWDDMSDAEFDAKYGLYPAGWENHADR